MRAVQRVSRSWKTVTSSGLTIISTPHAAGARLCVVVSRDRQQRLGRDVGHRREDRREHEEQERVVADDHARTSRAAAAPRARTRRRAGCSGRRSRTRAAASGSTPSQRWFQLPPIRKQAAERRADRDAEVLRDAHRRVRGLLPLGRDEVGDHRLVGRAAERAEGRQQREQRQPAPACCPRRASRPSGTSAWKPQPSRISGRRPMWSETCAAEVADGARERRRRPGRRSRERSARRAAP